jgi:UDP-glucose 4-epimerase
MNTIVIGASGFIGNKICKMLSKNGHKVFAVSRQFSSDFNLDNLDIEMIQADITDSLFLTSFDSMQIDNVIFTVSLDKNTSETCSINNLVNINITSAWNIIEYFKDRNIKNFIYFSTIQVLGNFSNKIINEDTPKNPLNKYALTHSIVEDIILFNNRNSNVNFKILRLANGFGFNQNFKSSSWNLFLNDIILSSFRDGKIEIKSSGLETRDFIHLNEIISVVHFLLSNKTEDLVFNISSGNTLTLFETAIIVKEIYEKRYNKKLNLISNAFVQTSENLKYKVVSRNIIKNGYEISPFVLEEGIIDTYLKLEQYFGQP